MFSSWSLGWSLPWHVVNLPGITSSKKKKKCGRKHFLSSAAIKCQHPLSQREHFMPTFPLSMLGFCLVGACAETCAYCHNLREFIYSSSTLCLENAVCWCYRPPLAFTVFPSTIFSKISEPWEDGCM